MAGDKIECNACPVLCQISAGKTGACDRYANAAGVLVRVDPVVLLRKALDGGEGALVPFTAREGDPADPSAGLLPAEGVFVTGIGSSTTYPDYKPAPFIVASQAEGVDLVTVVTEGIFSYCSLKVKIDTDRWLGPEQANVRCRGEVVGHVTTIEYGSQMLSLGGVHHLTGGSKKEGRVTCEMMKRWATSRRSSSPSTAARRWSSRPARRPSSTAWRSSACAWAAARPPWASSPSSSSAMPTRWWWSTTTSPACSPSTRPGAASACGRRASRSGAASRRRAATSRSPTPAPAGAAPTSPTRCPSSKAGTPRPPGRA
jgi:hypothetical protein